MAKQFMLKWNEKVGKLELVAFDRAFTIASVDSGQPIIPVWMDILYQQLARGLS